MISPHHILEFIWGKVEKIDKMYNYKYCRQSVQLAQIDDNICQKLLENSSFF